VSAAASEPAPCRVVYSERVRQRLLALADVARERGDGEAFLAALRNFTAGCVSTPNSESRCAT
jgi:hypothetical protein